MKLNCFIPSCVLFLLSSPVDAAGMPNLIDTLMRLPMPGVSMSYEGVIARLSDPIRSYDLNRNGLDSDDIDLVVQVRTARERANQLRPLLAFDLNNDREVSREEVDRVDHVSFGGNGDVRQILSQFDTLDADRNGILDWDEMGAPRKGGDITYDSSLKAIVSFDPTPDTAFTLQDAKMLADQLFENADKDKNGVLDRDELNAARR